MKEAALRRALLAVRVNHDTYRRYGYGPLDPNRMIASWAAYIASGRWPHSAAEARDGFCYCDWCIDARRVVPRDTARSVDT